MKNLKSTFEKEYENTWKDSVNWEAIGKKGKRIRKGKSKKRLIEDRRKARVRSTWE